jgi:hypothetical protein
LSERASSRIRSAPRSGIAALALVLAAGIAAAVASAHGPDADAGLDVRLDPLAPELAGVRAQVQRTVAQQLVVENTTDRVLEVLDERGTPFVRIGPDGVEGNLASPAWYRGYAPEGRVPPDLLQRIARGEAPEARWVRARREPTWGWFDARLAADSHGADAHGPRRFEVPVRIGGVASALRGQFVPVPTRTGTLAARLLSPGDLAPGVRIALVPGRVASFLLQSDAQEPVTVLGRDGEPFVRLSPAGVEANLHSATFADAARLRGGASLALEPDADAPPRWERLTSTPSYGWVDLRTAYPEADVPEKVARGGKPVELLRWAVPVRIGAADDAPVVRIEGVTEWKPFAAGPAKPGKTTQ